MEPLEGLHSDISLVVPLEAILIDIGHMVPLEGYLVTLVVWCH